jgi:predicted membrane protein
MNLFFLIPLTASLLASYICKNSADELAYLTAVIAAASLILSLVIAPWQLQLLVIAFVLVSTKKLLQQNEYKMQQMGKNHKARSQQQSFTD